MGKRGPVPTGKIAIVDFKQHLRPSPPFGMTVRARNLFRKIVGESPVGTFDAESVVMLRAFCEADNQHYTAIKMLEKEGAVTSVCLKTGATVNRRNPWFDVMKESSSVMSSLSTKLRNKGAVVASKAVKENPREGLMFGR